MRPIDVDTLLLVYQILAALVLAFVLAGAWHARNVEALWLWAAGFAAAWATQVLRIPIVELWGYRASLPVGHSGAVLHAALLLLGVRSFLRLRPRPDLVVPAVAAVIVASAASVYALGMRPGWSLALTQLATALLLLAGAFDAARSHRRSRHASLRIMAGVLGVSALVAAVRGAGMLSSMFLPPDAISAAVQRANAPWLLATLLLLVAQGFAILLLVNGALQREVRALADQDPLTGLLNRRGLGTRLQALRQDGEARLAVALVDLDRFKEINDRFGHPAGDQVLVGVARRLRILVRSRDLVARMGGEEFVLVLQDAVPGALAPLAERVREAVAALPIDTDTGPIHATVSVGVASLRAGEPLADALRRADQALYRAKREGRNRVVHADLAVTA